MKGQILPLTVALSILLIATNTMPMGNWWQNFKQRWKQSTYEAPEYQVSPYDIYKGRHEIQKIKQELESTNPEELAYGPTYSIWPSAKVISRAPIEGASPKSVEYIPSTGETEYTYKAKREPDTYHEKLSGQPIYPEAVWFEPTSKSFERRIERLERRQNELLKALFMQPVGE